MEYRTPEYQEVFEMPRRCKELCKHHRMCFGWEGHRGQHHFAMACKRCDADMRYLIRIAAEDLKLNI